MMTKSNAKGSMKRTFPSTRILTRSTVIIALTFALCVCPFFSANVSATTSTISVNGTHITIAGVNASTTIKGIDETTGLVFAIDAFVNGHNSYLGCNMNFPIPDTGKLQVTNISQFFYAYAWFVAHYNLSAVRIGASDYWATNIFYNAWLNHQSQFFQVLDAMAKEFYLRGIYFELVIAGSQEYPAYAFGGTGNVFTHSHTTGTAYQKYYTYAKSVAQHFNNSAYNSALFGIDCWNEPDHTSCVAGFWHTNKTMFNAWATNVASDMTPQSPHIIDMGVGGIGDNLYSFSQSDFNSYTGNTGFDVCHRHYYASANDNYLFDDPNHWSDDAGKPLIWGEIANNQHYPYTRWTFAENRITSNLDGAYFAMVMRGTSGYPYYSAYPVWQSPNVTPTPETNNTSPGPINNYTGSNTSDTLILVRPSYQIQQQMNAVVAIGILMLASTIPMIAFMEKQIKKTKKK